MTAVPREIEKNAYATVFFGGGSGGGGGGKSALLWVMMKWRMEGLHCRSLIVFSGSGIFLA